MLRAAILALVLSGCDQLFKLSEVPMYVPPPPDAAIDAPPDAPPTFMGCSDMSREGFADPGTYPAIAACAGAWSLPGLRDPVPACARKAGNDGVTITGVGCSAADLCADGWHVCQTKLDVASSQPVALRSCAGLGAAANMFFGTAQDGAAGDCDSVDVADDFIGCGTYGVAAQANCLPLDKTPSNMCSSFGGVGGWNCPDFDNEVTTVTKTEPFVGGGVLCCRDAM